MTRPLPRRGARLLGVTALGLTLALPLHAGSGAAAGPPAPTTSAASQAPEADYVVVLEEGSDGAAAGVGFAAQRLGLPVGERIDGLVPALVVTATPAEAVALGNAPGVAWVERSQTYTTASAAGTLQRDPAWGLDRIDQRPRKLDGRFRTVREGAGVQVFVVDTGLNRSHREFTGRTVEGFSSSGQSPRDCNGHGTHVAGTAVGTTFGVAKRASVVPVRVLSCRGQGSTPQVVAGLNWVARHASGPSVVNLSLTGTPSRAIDAAVDRLVGLGIPVVTAAGNSGADACRFSPARAPRAITVGATNRDDTRAFFSNRGRCLDLWAPGVGVRSAGLGGDRDTAVLSGTSMASPHVAGAVALYRSNHPCASPRQVADAVLGATTRTRGIRLLYTSFRGMKDRLGTQVVCRGGFAGGDDGWWAATPGTVVGRQHSRFAPPAAGRPQDSLVQRVNTPGGTRLESVSFRARTVGTPGAASSLDVVLTPTRGVPFGCVVDAADLDEEWQRVTCDGPGLATRRGGQPYELRAGTTFRGSAGGLFLLDDVRVVFG